MNKREWEIAGESQPLSAQDVEDILKAVRSVYPTAKVITHWNGKGCYTMSVGVDLGDPTWVSNLRKSRERGLPLKDSKDSTK